MTTRGLAPARTVLDNGAVIVAKESGKTPAVSINLALRAGSIGDPPGAAGSTYLLSQTIDRGTERRPASEIAEALDDRGITLSFGVTRHLFSVVCTCLAPDVEFVLALLAEIVSMPSVPESELATRKGEAVTTLRQDEDNPAIRAVERLMSLLYGSEHPYGRPARGTIATIEAATRESLLDLHRQRFAPGELSVVLVGDLDVQHVFDVARAVFGSWSAPSPRPIDVPHPAPAAERRRIVIPMMNKSQADIAYGFTTITRSDPSYFPFWLMNNVFGQYALGGRLGDSIRERQGMAYYVSSTFDPNVVEGPLLIRAGVSAANVDRAIASIDEEIAALVRDGISDKEIAESRQYMIGSMPRALETNAGIAQFLQTSEFFGLGEDYDVRLPDRLHAVTRDQVHDVARRFLAPERATIVVAGPYEG